jgi:hypothetical protein
VTFPHVANKLAETSLAGGIKPKRLDSALYSVSADAIQQKVCKITVFLLVFSTSCAAL